MSKSWEPKLNGPQFCSPACGRGCTWNEYQNAKKRGEEVAAQLGSGWEAVVWENLGWHWAVYSTNGMVNVRERRTINPRHRFIAYACERPLEAAFKHSEAGKSPRAAVEKLVKWAMAEAVSSKNWFDRIVASGDTKENLG